MRTITSTSLSSFHSLSHNIFHEAIAPVVISMISSSLYSVLCIITRSRCIIVNTEISLNEFLDAWKELEVKKARRDFIDHLAAYVIINLFLVFINLWTSPEQIWFVWPLTGWGIESAFHAYFSRPSRVIESVESKAMEIEMYARKKKR
ncbi:MAG: 2TM domain-containing protein [Desulfurococcus sp.]